MPGELLEANQQFEVSETKKTLLDASLHQVLTAVKRNECEALVVTATDLEWQL